MNASTAQEILDQWGKLLDQRAYNRNASRGSRNAAFQREVEGAYEQCLAGTLLAAMPELAPLLRREIEASQPRVGRVMDDKQALRNAVA